METGNLCGLKVILKDDDLFNDIHIPVPLTAVDITARLVSSALSHNAA